MGYSFEAAYSPYPFIKVLTQKSRLFEINHQSDVGFGLVYSVVQDKL